MSILAKLSSWFTGPTEARSILDDPRYSFSDPGVIEMLMDGAESASGVVITADKFLSVAAVWQCVNTISGDIARLPLNLYERIDDTDRQVARLHPVNRLIRKRPNDESTAFDLWRTAIAHKLIWGNAFLFIERDFSGTPISLIPLLPDRTTAKRVAGQLIYVTEAGGMQWPIKADDVLHIKGVSVDSVYGCAPLKYAKETAARALQAGNFASYFFKQGAKAGGILELPATMNKTAKDKLEEGFRKTYEGANNWFKTVVLRDGAKFHQLTISPNDGQMNETRESEVREVARFFNIPPSRLGLSDSVSYNSKSEDNQNYLDSCLSPHLVQLAQECEYKLLTDEEWDSDTYFIEHNTKQLLQMNPLSQAQYMALLIRVGVLSPNECRTAMNYNKREGGDEFTPQTNLIPNGPATSLGGADPGVLGGNTQRAIRASLVFALARHARDKSKKPEAWRQWLDGNLVSYRKECEQAGLPNETIETRLEAMRAIQVDDKLASSVNELATQWELEQCCDT